ncbi:MAG: sugar ABC transporter ATP-binding protein, partial [Microbacteriaceae bacterium]|nr:sugar ABC transporter ATP-binding protein [Microbacteriaceae bacterium]
TKPFAFDEAVTAMLGEAMHADSGSSVGTLRGGETAMRIRGLRVLRESAPIDLDLRDGEVTGIIGLIGAGKTELLESLFGAGKRLPGELELDGSPYAPRHPKDAVARGVHLVPEDRAAQGMLPGWSIARTLSLPFLARIASGGVLHRGRENAVAASAIRDFRVVATGPGQSVDALSGGNQQKVMVARWMQIAPKLLLLDEPFRGVDIGARREISRRASEQAERGACVVVATSDVDELREMADRIVVMVEGRVALDARADEVSNEQIVSSMSEVA